MSRLCKGNDGCWSCSSYNGEYDKKIQGAPKQRIGYFPREKLNHHICCNMMPMADGCPLHYCLGFSFILTGNSEIEIFIWFSMYIL